MDDNFDWTVGELVAMQVVFTRLIYFYTGGVNMRVVFPGWNRYTFHDLLYATSVCFGQTHPVEYQQLIELAVDIVVAMGAAERRRG
ncbi:hypothetical protein VE02_07751 [Pseudogymnoascus sp. 03VT05]|nr:hypothetical protein VE02_07751 [Pseudogymnoascus sp. 03VT05]